MQPRRFCKPAAALLAALACAALVAAGAAPTRGHESGGAASRALARRTLRGMESSIAPAAGSNVTTKGLAEDIDTLFTGLGNLLSYGLSNVKEHWAGECNYGKWCGEKCPPEGSDPNPTPINALDERCKEHDSCLSTSDRCQQCVCHADLLAGIQQVLSDEDCLGDNWAGDRCQAIEAVKEAPSIALGIKAKMGMDNCQDYAWRERCPSKSYTYTVDIKTSCNAGAGTDGAVRVSLTDNEGNVFSSNELDALGNDRVMCMTDTYEFEPTGTKVLMNCDATCQVYFRPVGLFAGWEPEYVRFSRASDGEETYSVKFCARGKLSDEGWYTFSCCS